ncbi:flagellar motor switch protein FliM [Limisalsivibrio acetivorans]|uniref:flagellar motor switch protein FliM n=1 Tax=Limisalsivibrio acetivorans TaxID=1304888 RepID=UPI0003B54797|nr:flagellar motor switch protein FliM [Limisalsivibrio acetivorans]
MADILSQEEIDALLSTVSTEEDLSDDSLQQLDFVPKKISVYDFRRPDRVSKEQLRSIRNLHDKFARNFSSSLSNFLRTITDITLVSVDQMTYGEFLMSLPDPTSFNILSMIPMEGNSVLEINPSLIFPIVDKLLGGQGQPLFQSRELTNLEQHIIEGILSLILKDLEEVWRQIVPNVRLKKELSENSPHIIQIVAQNEVVVLVVFEVKFGEATGMMNLCIPAIVLEPVLGKISSQDWLIGAKKGKFGDNEEHILEMLEAIPIEMRTNLGGTRLTIEDILNLKQGELVMLDMKSNLPVDVFVNNDKKFNGQMGTLGVKKAVKITDIIVESVDEEESGSE